jgi:NAD(P)H-hydrate epimerase
MVVIGPGLPLESETQQLVRELVSGIGRPVLIDGDGITAVISNLNLLPKRKPPTILTPHVGEMCRITGMDKEALLKNRIEILRKTAKSLNAVMVLKGPHSLVGLPDGRVFINMSGNPGMATAGSGDALTGTIAAMYGLGLTVEQAVRKGVFIHGLSGDLAARDKGEDGITAQDVLDYLPLAMMYERKGMPEALKEKYELPVIV